MNEEVILPDQEFLMPFRSDFDAGEMRAPNCYKRYNRDWLLTEHGDMMNVVGYEIWGDRLTEEDWLLHLMQKRWFDANTFLPAYMEALRRSGRREMKQWVTYERG